MIAFSSGSAKSGSDDGSIGVEAGFLSFDSHAKAGACAWEAICRDMESEFRAGRFEVGAIHGIAAVSRRLTEHFPAEACNPDELANVPVIL